MKSIRKAIIKELSVIMGLIAEAQQFLKESRVDQWQNGYPSADIIRHDINQGNGYVVTNLGDIVAFATVIFSEEPTYRTIYNGAWLTDGDYAVIHRIAVSNQYKGKGVGRNLLQSVEQMAIERQLKSVRIDTHEDNLSMQRLIRKMDYCYCGEIFLKDGQKRIAFEKIIG